jgi:hypothetical protein
MTMRITIDGQPLEAAEGETILQAALRHGIYIPNLCHHPDLPPAGEQEQVDWVYRGDQAFAGTQAAGCASSKSEAGMMRSGPAPLSPRTAWSS